MSWEFNRGEQPENVKDRTRLVWVGILVAVVLMAVLLAITTRPTATAQSRAYVKHIYVPFDRNFPEERDRSLELMADVRSRILANELSFEEAARQYSAEGDIAKRGGHLGWVTKEDFVEGKATQFIWNGPVGELSSILESNLGFHLLFIEKRELSAAEQYERELKQRVIEGAEPPQD
jgi:hypothetical protein